MGFVLSVYIMKLQHVHNAGDNITLMGFGLSVYIMIFITTTCTGDDMN